MRAELDLELFRHILEHSPDVLIVLDAEGRFEYLSPAARVVFQRDPSQRIGASVYDLPPELRVPAVALFESMRRGERNEGSVDGLVRLLDGTERRLERNARAIRNPDGSLRAVLIVTRDAHERYLAEGQLRDGQEQLRFVAENTRDVIWTLDAKGFITYATPSTTRMFGWALSERIGLHISKTFHSEEFMARGMELFAKAQRGEIDEVVFEGRQIRKDGSSIWVEVTGRVVRDAQGAMTSVVLVTRDITERREAERALRENEERLRFIMDNTRDVVWTIDRSGVITYVSPSIERVFGRRPSDRIGTHVSTTFLASPYVATGLELIQKAQRGEIGDVSFEAQQQRDDGTLLWVEIAGRVLRDATGAMTSAVMVTRDIDERKKTEQLLERQRARLQQRSQELAEALRDLESFASMVSHDLQGPLRRIEALATSMTTDVTSSDALERIKTVARQGNAIVDGLLDLARFGSRAMTVETVDLSRQAEEILAECADAEPRRTVATDVEPGLTATGDTRLLHVLLRNLLTNAWKFTASAVQPRIRVGAETSAEGGRIYFVEDNGEGFDPAHVGAMFRPFVRVTDGGEPGFGIGLATVELIVHRHGGRVWAAGSPGQGARFSFTLPGIFDDRRVPDDPAPLAHR